MKAVRKTLFYLLVMTLPLSAWAGAGAPCAESSGAGTGAQVSMADAHAHHDAALLADADNDTESTPVECPCCDGCATACVLSSCSPVALFTSSGLTAHTDTGMHCSRADAFRDGPPPHVLFRPPIVSV